MLDYLHPHQLCVIYVKCVNLNKGVTDGSHVCACTCFPSFFVASNATEKVSIAFGYVLSLYQCRLLPATSTSIFRPTVMRKAANRVAMSACGKQLLYCVTCSAGVYRHIW